MFTETPMRLIKVSDLEMELFDRSQTLPPYNILSHMWYSPKDYTKESYEVTFDKYKDAWKKSRPGYKPSPGESQDKGIGPNHKVGRPEEEIAWVDLLDPPGKDISKTTGWGKIAWTCWKTRTASESEKATHIWIDTCCINKGNTSEEAGAIASMADWYAGAEKCYTYMQDVSINAGESRKAPAYERYNDKDHGDIRRRFEHSRWFSRGWTLQELLAPSNLEFYDHDWKSLGSRDNRKQDIHKATGIAEEFLDGKAHKKACIAVKMSWMAPRYTTLVEDMAYALLGILEAKMSPNYGGGATEFIRMQESLIQQGSTDESIFVWTDPKRNLDLRPEEGSTVEGKYNAAENYGLLAPWPTCFIGTRNVTTHGVNELPRVPYRIENGSTIFPLASRWPEDGQGGTNWNRKTANERTRYDLSLNCWVTGSENDGHITIRLVREDPNAPWTREVTDQLIVAPCKRKSTSTKFGVAGPKTHDASISHIPAPARGWGSDLSHFCLDINKKEYALATVEKRDFKRQRSTLKEKEIDRKGLRRFLPW